METNRHTESKTLFSNRKFEDSYYFQGFTTPSLSPGPVLNSLLTLLREIRESQLKGGFSWQESYEGTCDLKPSAHQYSSLFMDFLFEQRLPQRVREITGFSDLVLGDIAVRQILPERTYLGWHRDTHSYGSLPISGRTPPLHKVIFYPNLDNDPSVQIRFIPRSHLKFFHHWRLDQIQAMVSPRQSLVSSNDRVLLFNSMLLHHVPPKAGPKGAYRLIFNFCHRSQLESFPAQKQIHESFLKRMGEPGSFPITPEARQ